MSVLQFLTSGGMASIGGDLPEEEQKAANEIVKTFAERVRKHALSLQVPASLLSVQQCTYLFVAKDTGSLHFAFVAAPGSNSLNYRDFTSYGRVELQTIVHQIRVEVGEVIWAFSCPLNVPPTELDNYIATIVAQYVASVLQSQKKPSKTISNEALSSPEIASGVEKFRADYPLGSKTAFIIMQFGNIKPCLSGCHRRPLDVVGLDLTA